MALFAAFTEPMVAFVREQMARIGGPSAVVDGSPVEIETDSWLDSDPDDGLSGHATTEPEWTPGYAELGLEPLDSRPLEPDLFDYYEKKMRPVEGFGGGVGSQGYLGPEESLAELLAQDQRIVDGLGVTHLQLASVLQMFAALASRTPPTQARGLDDGLAFQFNNQPWQVISVKPYFRSQFVSPIVGIPNTREQVLIRNLATNTEVQLHGLYAPLIARGFYQGKGDPRFGEDDEPRFAPQELYDFLNGGQPLATLRRTLREGGFPHDVDDSDPHRGGLPAHATPRPEPEADEPTADGEGRSAVRLRDAEWFEAVRSTLDEDLRIALDRFVDNGLNIANAVSAGPFAMRKVDKDLRQIARTIPEFGSSLPRLRNLIAEALGRTVDGPAAWSADSSVDDGSVARRAAAVYPLIAAIPEIVRAELTDRQLEHLAAWVAHDDNGTFSVAEAAGFLGLSDPGSFWRPFAAMDKALLDTAAVGVDQRSALRIVLERGLASGAVGADQPRLSMTEPFASVKLTSRQQVLLDTFANEGFSVRNTADSSAVEVTSITKQLGELARAVGMSGSGTAGVGVREIGALRWQAASISNRPISAPRQWANDQPTSPQQASAYERIAVIGEIADANLSDTNLEYLADWQLHDFEIDDWTIEVMGADSWGFERNLGRIPLLFASAPSGAGIGDLDALKRLLQSHTPPADEAPPIEIQLSTDDDFTGQVGDVGTASTPGLELTGTVPVAELAALGFAVTHRPLYRTPDGQRVNQIAGTRNCGNIAFTAAVIKATGAPAVALDVVGRGRDRRTDVADIAEHFGRDYRTGESVDELFGYLSQLPDGSAGVAYVAYPGMAPQDDDSTLSIAGQRIPGHVLNFTVTKGRVSLEDYQLEAILHPQALATGAILRAGYDRLRASGAA
ncbi:MAG: hypothetical protein ACRCY9_19935, partial [Phycicoccus sp.]